MNRDMQRPKLLSLPWEVLSEIFKLLPTEDRLRTLPLICKPCRSFAVNPCTIWQEIVLNDRVLTGPLRLPSLYSWFNHHGEAIKHLTLKDTVSFDGAYLEVDNIPGVPLLPPARRGGINFPALGLIFSLCQNLECVIVKKCGSRITATELSLLANCRQLHTLCITTTATVSHIGTQSLSSLTCLHTLALHIQSGDRSIPIGEVLAVSNMNHPLPAGLDALTILTSLCLSGWTHAMLLPTAISCLKRLRLLSLQNCSIMSLPDSLQQLTDLESLNLHMNKMGRNVMPRYSFACDYAEIFGSKDTSQHCLSHASKLTSIELSLNFLQVPPKFLGGASNLRSLDLSYNDFGSNSLDDLSTLIELTGLILISCQLTNFPSCTAQLGCMKELWLCCNNIASLPNDMPWDNLRVLDMHSNNLLDFPYSALEAAPQLSYLNISDNKPLQVDERLVSWTLSSSTRRPLFDICKEGLTTTSDSELWDTESLKTLANLPEPTRTPCEILSHF